MTIVRGTRSYVEVDRMECRDQCNRVEDLQCALHHAAQLFGAVAHDRLDRDDAMSAIYFASLALESTATGQAEDASAFMAKFYSRIRDEQDSWETGVDAEGGCHADHA